MTGPGGDGERGGRRPPSTSRIVLWVVGGAVGAYFLISGVVGILTHS